MFPECKTFDEPREDARGQAGLRPTSTSNSDKSRQQEGSIDGSGWKSRHGADWGAVSNAKALI